MTQTAIFPYTACIWRAIWDRAHSAYLRKSAVKLTNSGSLS